MSDDLLHEADRPRRDDVELLVLEDQDDAEDVHGACDQNVGADALGSGLLLVRLQLDDLGVDGRVLLGTGLEFLQLGEVLFDGDIEGVGLVVEERDVHDNSFRRGLTIAGVFSARP